MSRWHRSEFDFLPERAFIPRPGGRMTLEGGGGGGDNGASQAQMVSTMQQAQATRDQLDWAKSVYAQEAPMRDSASALANQVSQAQLDQMRQQTAIAAQAQDDYNKVYRPLEQNIVADAQNFDSPARRADASAKAIASVEQNLAAQRGASVREMERAGVNPASGKMLALQAGMDLNAAKAKAGASSAAVQGMEAQGYARRMDAANLGRGIASSQGTNAAMAAQLGTSAVGSMNSGIAASQSGNGLIQGAYNSAIQGYGSAANSYGGMASAAQSAANQRSANLAAGVGALGSIAAVAL